MSRDPQFLLMIQIALIGIVVVVGFFYIWKTLSRLEARIDELSSRDCHDINQSCSMLSNTLTNPQDGQTMTGGKIKNENIYTDADEDEDEDEEEDNDNDNDNDEYEDEDNHDDDDDIALMRACFNGIPLQQLMDESASPFTIFKRNTDNDSNSDDDTKFTKKSGITLSEAKESHDTIHKDSMKADSHLDEDSVSFTDTDTHEYSKTKLKKMNLDALRDICSSRGLQTDGSKVILVDRVLSSFPVSV